MALMVKIREKADCILYSGKYEKHLPDILKVVFVSKTNHPVSFCMSSVAGILPVKYCHLANWKFTYSS